MAKIISPFELRGKVNGMTMYKLRNDDDGDSSAPGIPLKNQLQQSSTSAGKRRMNKEFAGKSRAATWLRQALWPQLPIADINLTDMLIGLAGRFQALDTDNPVGIRSVLFSKKPGLMNGLDLNRQNQFDFIIRCRLDFSIKKESMSATVHMPALVPEDNFHIPVQESVYSIVVSLGMLPDIHYNANGYTPHDLFRTISLIDHAETGWTAVANGLPAQTFRLQLNDTAPGHPYSLALSAGIRFGTINTQGVVKRADHTGAAKILTAV